MTSKTTCRRYEGTLPEGVSTKGVPLKVGLNRLDEKEREKKRRRGETGKRNLVSYLVRRFSFNLKNPCGDPDHLSGTQDLSLFRPKVWARQ